jgi:hypothetical protein
VHLFDGGDQLVESNRLGLNHVVNNRLTGVHTSTSS